MQLPPNHYAPQHISPDIQQHSSVRIRRNLQPELLLQIEHSVNVAIKRELRLQQNDLIPKNGFSRLIHALERLLEQGEGIGGISDFLKILGKADDVLHVPLEMRHSGSQNGESLLRIAIGVAFQIG